MVDQSFIDTLEAVGLNVVTEAPAQIDSTTYSVPGSFGMGEAVEITNTGDGTARLVINAPVPMLVLNQAGVRSLRDLLSDLLDNHT